MNLGWIDFSDSETGSIKKDQKKLLNFLIKHGKYELKTSKKEIKSAIQCTLHHFREVTKMMQNINYRSPGQKVG